jgi:hypothetical protein
MQVPGTVVGAVRALRLRLLELLGAGPGGPPKLLSTVFLGWESGRLRHPADGGLTRIL